MVFAHLLHYEAILSCLWLYFVWCSFKVLPCFSSSFKYMSYIIHTHYFHFIHWVKIYYSHYFYPQNFSRFGQWKFLVDGFYVLLACSHYYLSNFLFSGIRYSRLLMLSLPLAKNQPFFQSPGFLWRMVFRNQDLLAVAVCVCIMHMFTSIHLCLHICWKPWVHT